MPPWRIPLTRCAVIAAALSLIFLPTGPAWLAAQAAAGSAPVGAFVAGVGSDSGASRVESSPAVVAQYARAALSSVAEKRTSNGEGAALTATAVLVLALLLSATGSTSDRRLPRLCRRPFSGRAPPLAV